MYGNWRTAIAVSPLHKSVILSDPERSEWGVEESAFVFSILPSHKLAVPRPFRFFLRKGWETTDINLNRK
jgi:hypothetical protein